MFELRNNFFQSFVPSAFVFLFALALSSVAVANGLTFANGLTPAKNLKPAIQKEITCYAIESESNEFALVRLNFEVNSVITTVYGASDGDTLVAREIVEYSDSTIGNLPKAQTCFPVHGTQDGILSQTIRFADSCAVMDPTGFVTSVGIKYKIDLTRRKGELNVKSYFFDGSIFAERNYSFYSCF